MFILVDASVFYAFFNVKDIFHIPAQKIMKEIIEHKYGVGLITDYLFDEIVTVAMRKLDKEKAIQLGNNILSSELFLEPIDDETFRQAWILFQSTSHLGFTDCTNLAFMKLFGITKIATFDKAFKNVKGIEVIDE